MKTGLQHIFDARTQSIYGGMRTRFGPFVEDGVVVRPGREVPFTLVEFRIWIVRQFGGSWDRSTPCFYCTAPVNVNDFVIDHKTPASSPWLGSLDLDNLCVSCRACNTLKGKMAAPGFIAFLRFLHDSEIAGILDPRDVGDIMVRLKTGGDAKKFMWKRHDAKRKALPQPKKSGGLF
jgi:hypothetical protein